VQFCAAHGKAFASRVRWCDYSAEIDMPRIASAELAAARQNGFKEKLPERFSFDARSPLFSRSIIRSKFGKNDAGGKTLLRT
jgi:hypothetical protein